LQKYRLLGDSVNKRGENVPFGACKQISGGKLEETIYFFEII